MPPDETRVADDASLIQSDNSPMKLATYKDGSRDGQLVVVSRDLSLAVYASHIANRLQPVLDDWNYLSPQLQDLYDTLNNGRARHAFAFDPAMCLAPLPRAYQWVQGATQRSGDALSGPCDRIVCANLSAGLDCVPVVAVVTGDVPLGCPADRALDGIRLVMLANDVRVRGTVPDAVPDALPTAFSPVAVTPDELGAAWTRGEVQLAIQVTWNGRKVPTHDQGAEKATHFGQHIANLCKTRAVRAGSIVGSGISSHPPCAIENLQYGDTVHVEMKAADGASLFGAIAQEVVAASSN